MNDLTPRQIDTLRRLLRIAQERDDHVAMVLLEQRLVAALWGR